MGPPEAQRLALVRQVMDRPITLTQAAQALHVSVRQAKPQVHSPRARRASSGEWVQIDGGQHDGFEQRAPQVLPDRLQG